MDVCAVMSVGGSAFIRQGACGASANVEGEGAAGDAQVEVRSVWSGRFKGAHGCCGTGTDKPRLAGADSNAIGQATIRAAVGGDCSAAVRRGVAAKGLFQDVWGWLQRYILGQP